MAKRGRQPRGPGWVDPRAEAMRALYEGGVTMEDIGALYGITRERTRQLLKLAGVASRRRGRYLTDSLDIIGRLRRSTAASMASACIEVGVDRDVADRIIARVGMSKAFARLFRLRRRHVVRSRRDDLALRLATLAQAIGHTPTIADVNGNDGTPCHTTYFKVFGSMRAAQDAAGLLPNARGGWHRAERLPA